MKGERQWVSIPETQFYIVHAVLKGGPTLILMTPTVGRLERSTQYIGNFPFSGRNYSTRHLLSITSSILPRTDIGVQQWNIAETVSGSIGILARYKNSKTPSYFAITPQQRCLRRKIRIRICMLRKYGNSFIVPAFLLYCTLFILLWEI